MSSPNDQARSNSRLRFGSALALALASLTGCFASERVANWPADCVGRFELALPGPAEIATTTNGYLYGSMGMAPPSSNARKVAFGDGEGVQFSEIGYIGDIRVSAPQTTESLRRLLDAHVQQRLARARKNYEGTTYSGRRYHFELVPGQATNLAAWWSPISGLDAVATVGDRLLDMSFGERAFEAREVSSWLDSLNRRIEPREVFTVPGKPGVCLPYAFIADDGKQARYMALNYKLQQQPDVVVTFRDATAARTEPGARTRNAEPEPAMVSIWSQHLTKFKEVKPMWAPSTRSVKLAGYSGLASFMQLTREDGSIDYGYLAIVRGNPDAKEDTPDLMLYMIRNAERARAKGLEPVGKEAFIEMAETIAASVKRRPVQ